MLMKKAFASIVTASMVALLVLVARAQAGPLGEWHGDFHNVPAASCNPHCQILGGGIPQGEDYDFTDAFPGDTLLNADEKHIACSDVGNSNGCVFTQPLCSISVDNTKHTVYTHCRSHSGAIKVQPVVSIYQMQSASH
jgi:hypothetical protein